MNTMASYSKSGASRLFPNVRAVTRCESRAKLVMLRHPEIDVSVSSLVLIQLNIRDYLRWGTTTRSHIHLNGVRLLFALCIKLLYPIAETQSARCVPRCKHNTLGHVSDAIYFIRLDTVGLASLYDQTNVVSPVVNLLRVQSISFMIIQSAEFARREHWSRYSIPSALKMRPKWVNSPLVFRKVYVLSRFHLLPSDEMARFTTYDTGWDTFRGGADYGCRRFGCRNPCQHIGWDIHHTLKMVDIQPKSL